MTAAARMDLSACPKVAALYRLQYEEVQKSWVLLYPEGMVKLNASAGEIMSRLDGQRPVSEIIARLERDFNTGNLSEDVLDFLAIAQNQGWVKA
ncbi:pyrroloquinoline quinone biosynthesis peptide chaperone PqqD [Limnohabitans sp. DM1]|uniref:pyrroloquinoline quinone biosynthesis peptide chaperone PqqD n=1 Tax=Limnohabitans sp. DM1 TaxID=1597955 RepID=UPI000AE5DD5B|nr:pyrroloquinoline quinone biosynthesis peptide chaperone PqqD [Limnohabitans sp. DM1]